MTGHRRSLTPPTYKSTTELEVEWLVRKPRGLGLGCGGVVGKGGDDHALTTAGLSYGVFSWWGLILSRLEDTEGWP